MFVADAHRGDGQRFVVRADEKLRAFVEIEAAIWGPLVYKITDESPVGEECTH
jgi:hypothetical protein